MLRHWLTPVRIDTSSQTPPKLENATSANYQTAVTANGNNFTLTGDDSSYLFQVGKQGDLVSNHFGGVVDEFVDPPPINPSGWVDGLGNLRREFPDVGRSDFRLPAIHISHADGNTVSAFTYQ